LAGSDRICLREMLGRPSFDFLCHCRFIVRFAQSPRFSCGLKRTFTKIQGTEARLVPPLRTSALPSTLRPTASLSMALYVLTMQLRGARSPRHRAMALDHHCLSSLANRRHSRVRFYDS
jgi:hypothetical protein